MNPNNPLGSMGQIGDLWTWSSVVTSYPALVSEFSVASGAQRWVTVEEVGYANGTLYFAKSAANTALTDTVYICVSAVAGGPGVVAVVNGTATLLA